MLTLDTPRRRSSPWPRVVLGCVAVILLGVGLYILSLVLAPAVAPLVATKPIDAAKLPAPTSNENRIIIPKIGVNIHYAPGAASLDRGAEWRYPDRGNPKDGGNFIVAAHRFSIQPTPQSTIEKSPFYQIDKLTVGDQILVDYNGLRYLYKISKAFDVKPSQTEIEARSDTPVLTLYTCSLEGSSDGRVVLLADPVGVVKT